jgi:hypothetical protein
MFGKQNYLVEAKKHETAFRAILDKYKIPHQDLTIEEIYNKYSEGNRYGIWTILDFYEKEEGVFLFSNEDIEWMSGSGRIDLWKLEDGKAVHFKNESFWMS